MSMIEFLRDNYLWITGLLGSIAAVIGAVAKTRKKGDKNHSQKIGNVSNSSIININGDLTVTKDQN